ncbi:hypothetical protein NHG29_04035 [Aerococcaceae bacterium NML160702]|nr:hypothetical protein [Aerococcaceae bacterium NML160702]
MSFKQLNNTAKQRALKILQYRLENDGFFPTDEELEEIATAYKYHVDGEPVGYAS